MIKYIKTLNNISFFLNGKMNVVNKDSLIYSRVKDFFDNNETDETKLNNLLDVNFLLSQWCGNRLKVINNKIIDVNSDKELDLDIQHLIYKAIKEKASSKSILYFIDKVQLLSRDIRNRLFENELHINDSGLLLCWRDEDNTKLKFEYSLGLHLVSIDPSKIEACLKCKQVVTDYGEVADIDSFESVVSADDFFDTI